MTNIHKKTKGRVLHHALGYDMLVAVLLLGRERRLREHLVNLARIQDGESVLDVGCGTGSLAIAAKRRVGPNGLVAGLDASPELIERGRKKAGKAGMDVAFTVDVVEQMPYPDATFDVALSTLMLHHLPRDIRRVCVNEMHRVLKPGGRVLLVDFGPSNSGERGIIQHFHRHAGLPLDKIIGLLNDGGFEVVECGHVGVAGLNYVLANPKSLPRDR